MTTFLDRILAPLGYSKAQPKPPSVALAQGEAARWDIPEASAAEKQTKLYAALTWLATAVDTVANIGAAAEFSVERMAGGPDGDDEDIPNHPFELLLRRPNPTQSRGEFLRDCLSWFKITGNLYLFQNAAREGAPPDELWIVPSTMIRPIPDGRSYIKGYEFQAPNQSAVFIDRWRVVHLKTFNPDNPFVGLSPVQSLALDAYGDLAQQKWNLALFDKNNGKFPGILAFKAMLDDVQWTRLKRERNEEWGGANRPGVTMLRGVGDTVQWLPAALSQKEMEFLEGRTFTKEEIYGKIAPGLASILAVNATEANAIAGKASLIEFGVWPVLDQLAQKFTAELLPLYGPDLAGEFDDIRETNRILDLQEMQEFAKYHTVNEVRHEYYGEDPLYLDPMQADNPDAQAQQDAEQRDAALAQFSAKAAKPQLDPRGLLFAAQIGPSTPLPGEKPPSAPPPPPMAQPTALMPDAAPAAVPDVPGGAQADELAKWEKFALARLGKGGRDFEPRVLPLFQAARIKAGLARATTRDAVRQVFAAERGEEVSEIAKLTAAIEAATLLLQE